MRRHGTGWGYKCGCRCDECVAANAAYRRDYKLRKGQISDSCGLPDDGIVDEVAVERLLNGTLDWRAATLPEREAAGRIAMQGDGGYTFCADVLHLGPSAMRRIREAVAA